VPVLPFVHTWDGLVSCLRTRTFGEMSELVDRVLVERRQGVGVGKVHGGSEEDEWTFSRVRERHTWPFGYMNAFVGIREDVRRIG